MVFKINIAENGKTWKLELEGGELLSKVIGDKINGKLLMPELDAYELEITGGTDEAGFPMYKEVEGIGLKRILFTKGWGFTTRSKNGRLPKGIRKRKTIRGNTISEKIVQINLTVSTAGSKTLAEIFPDQNKAPEPEAPVESTTEPTVETPAKAQVETPAEIPAA